MFPAEYLKDLTVFEGPDCLDGEKLGSWLNLLDLVLMTTVRYLVIRIFKNLHHDLGDLLGNLKDFPVILFLNPPFW